MRLVDVPGARLAVDDLGSGSPPFLFVHGLACNRSVWAMQAADLGVDHRCVLVDLRGCGESSADGPYDVVTAADDLAALSRQLGLGPAVVVGHSLGGLVVLQMNVRHPELVLGIVLGDSPVGAPPAPPERRGALRDRIREARSTQPIAPLIESFFTEDTGASVREGVRTMMLGCSPDVAAGMLDNDAVDDAWDEALKLADRKPVMAIWAQRPFGQPGRLREIMTFLRQEPIPGTGHFFQLEQPAITNALLRAFLDDVERDPRISLPGR